MRNVPIEGRDITEAVPVNGVVCLGGLVRSPYDSVTIYWTVDGSSGSTICRAWEGQHEIDGLVRAGYTILKITK